MSEEIPEECKKLLTASLSDSTWKQYKSIFTKWSKFCENQSVDLWQPTLSSILKFLSILYSDGLSYVSINSARSALSTLLGSVEGFPIGQHPLVVRLVKGVGRLRPPSCKYNYIWDASQVLSLFLNWKANVELDLKQLSYKTVGLLALCSAQRVQTLVNITVDKVHFTPCEVVIRIASVLKTTKPGDGCIISLKKYPDEKLCIYKCLKLYIEKTSALRKSNNLFVSYQSPYERASSQTVSRWLKEVLKLSGIDINLFSSHSFRHSSTSKAVDSGVCLDTIYKAAGWSQKSKVFAKFYKKPLLNADFSSSILGCVL
jgi:site-specific recombinase XerD